MIGFATLFGQHVATKELDADHDHRGVSRTLSSFNTLLRCPSPLQHTSAAVRLIKAVVHVPLLFPLPHRPQTQPTSARLHQRNQAQHPYQIPTQTSLTSNRTSPPPPSIPPSAPRALLRLALPPHHPPSAAFTALSIPHLPSSNYSRCFASLRPSRCCSSFPSSRLSSWLTLSAIPGTRQR